MVEKISAGFVLWLSEKAQKPASQLTVSVGHDSRISASRIQAAVVRALEPAGVTVYDCGLASTPSMFMTTIDLKCDGAVQITASHHPFNRNWIKFFTLTAAWKVTTLPRCWPWRKRGKSRKTRLAAVWKQAAYMKDYAKHLRILSVKG